MTSDEIRLGGIAVRFLLESERSGGALTMFEFDVDAASMAPPPHSHDAYEETIYGLRGVLTWTLEGEEVEVAPGDALFIPRGAVHRFENRGGKDATQLAVVMPGLLGPAYFRELRDVVAAAAGGPPDVAAIKDVMLRHGLTPAP
jgi:quercetin dioxygenase-like cupin family protein